MSSSIGLHGAVLYYRVKHPEFDPEYAYRAVGYIDYAESGWSRLLFVNERGMTYGVRVWRCLCLNPMTSSPPEHFLAHDGCGRSLPVAAHIIDEALIKLPWPKPRRKNPDLEDD